MGSVHVECLDIKKKLSELNHLLQENDKNPQDVKLYGLFSY